MQGWASCNFLQFCYTHTALYRILSVFLSLRSTDHFWATRHQEVVDETTAHFPRKAESLSRASMFQ